MLLDDAQHFVRDPDWTWYILFYFFFAGLSGGSYAIASLLRVFGRESDEGAARLGYYVSFVTLLPCPVLLTLDLGQPLRFWHMVFNTTPGEEGLSLKSWSPMSVGAWGLIAFAVFCTVSFVDALGRDGKFRIGLIVRPLAGLLGKVWATLGLIVALFIAGYTGVLLAVSNQPVWSDTWALGGLFLASGLSGSAALMAWLMRYRKSAASSVGALTSSERFFQFLELLLIVAFVVTLIPAGTLSRAFGMPWAVLWLVALIGLGSGLIMRGGARQTAPAPDGTVAVERVHAATLVSLIVLIGVLALRAAIIFSAQ
jgi:formate-dependent nitrite reductase membrane component NrfD